MEIDPSQAAMIIPWLKTLYDVIRDLRKTTREMPEGTERAKAESILEEVEQKLALAEAQIANDLKYQLCRNHWPPKIMLSADDFEWKCPECGNKKEVGKAFLQC